MRKSISFFIASCLLAQGFAQQAYQFKKGLFANTTVRYGREALYLDELAYRLYNGNLQMPVEGAVFGTDEKGEPVIWQPVEADSLNRLRAPGFGRRSGSQVGFMRGGYIYLTYTSAKEQTALLNIKGNSGVFVNGELHMGDAYNLGYLHIPVKLKKGLNEFYVRGNSATASLSFPPKAVFLNTDDPTSPCVVLNKQNGLLQAAIVVLNTSDKALKGLQVKSNLQGREAVTDIPDIPAMSSRKIPFTFDGSDITAKGRFNCSISILEKGKVLDEAKLPVEAVNPSEQYSSTFISHIDGSLQYYAVTPQSSGDTAHAALFLSVHGAGVEAMGQARAYKPKDWGTLVAATNRRPRGFNWEDWGRLDALEVLNMAKAKFRPDPQHIYLTGHSMGGHGTWFLGATYPDKWAAIGACSGYPTLKGYGSADGLIPDSSSDTMEQVLLRSSNQSDVIKLAGNYRSYGVYVLHGDSDKVVSVNYARQMRKVLGGFHADFNYYEYPGGEHWFGDQSVDWKPLFDFFKWHVRRPDSAVDHIDFVTASPGISSSCFWASVQQQIHPLQYSHIALSRNKAAKTISGSADNVRMLKLDLKDFPAGAIIKIMLDSGTAVSYTVKSGPDSIFLLKEAGSWALADEPGPDKKGPHRYGTLKDAFNNNMVFVYGTTGSREENQWSINKARYDAETWYYRGNGAVDIIPDKAFSPEKYKDRGVIIYGNKSTNAAWTLLLKDCPIQMESNKITAAGKTWSGDDLGGYFVWPIRNSAIASVAAIGGSGLKGMNAAMANQYFAGASGFPDFMIFSLDMLHKGASQLKMAGFYDNNWQLKEADFSQRD